MSPLSMATWAAFGGVAGWLSVRMILRPRRGPRTELVPIVAVAALVPLTHGGVTYPSAVGLLSVAVGAVGGWTAASYTLLREPDRTPARVASVAASAPRQVAVVYFTHGEPETYEPEPWVNMLYELDATVPRFPPKPVWPFILRGIKRSFDAVGSSPHRRIHGETLEAVRCAVGRQDVRWYVSFLDADPPLREVLEQAARDGATDIVFLTVFLTDSDHTAEVDNMVEAMGLREAGIRSVRTAVLWDDARLARMVADKIAVAAGARDRAHVGVMLVGHGQPKEWDLTHPTETEQEQAFRAAVKQVLVSDGFLPELVSDAWMSFRKPTVPQRVRELTRRGARTVIGVPVTISADSLHSLHDTPKLIRKGARGSSVEILDVGGWNTEPLLVELLAERTAEALGELDRQAAVHRDA